MRKKSLYMITLAIGLAIVVGGSTNASADDFYKGKTIRFVVGYAPGGGYDTYTRAAARFISQYIPGNPTPIVQNRTGAGSLIAANYTYKRAKADGLTLGIFNSGLILQQVLGSRGIRFQGDKFGWIGAPVIGLPACYVMGHTGLKTFDDVLKSNRPLNMGATRARLPLKWATTQNGLGSALLRIGTRESGTAKLEEAVAAYREAWNARSKRPYARGTSTTWTWTRWRSYWERMPDVPWRSSSG